MTGIKKLRKELRMLRLEQQWLKAKTSELRKYSAINKDKIKLLKEEIQKAAPQKPAI